MVKLMFGGDAALEYAWVSLRARVAKVRSGELERGASAVEWVVISMIVVTIVAVVGYVISQAEGTFDINTVMAGILVLTAFALLLDAAVGRIETRLMKWQPRSGETERL